MRISEKMKKRLLIIIPVFLALASFVLLPLKEDKIFEKVDIDHEFLLEFDINDTIKVLTPEKKNINETVLITELLKRYHYKHLPLSDSLSYVIFMLLILLLFYYPFYNYMMHTSFDNYQYDFFHLFI